MYERRDFNGESERISLFSFLFESHMVVHFPNLCSDILHETVLMFIMVVHILVDVVYIIDCFEIRMSYVYGVL